MPKYWPAHAVSSEPLWKTIKSESTRMWPFVVGFGATFGLVMKMSLGITEEDIKASKFANPGGHHH